MTCKEPVQVSSLKTVAREFAWHKLDLIIIQEVRWDKGSTVRGDYIFSMEEGTKIINLERVFFCTPQNTISSYESRVY